MPIYAYRCAACGHARDVLQKISDPTLSVCPACGADQFQKQVTAAGFQLKGSGWYVTDFRNNGSAAGAAKAPEGKPAADNEGTAPAPASTAAAPANPGSSAGADSTPTSSAAASSASPPAPSGGGGSGGGCACH